MSQLTKYIQENTWLSHMTHQAAWGLVDVISNLGPRVKGIEIGVNQGVNSYMLLDACPNITKLVGVDPYVSYQDWQSVVSQESMDEAYAAFRENYELMRDRFELFKMKSQDAALELKDGDFDFVFIDGDHSIKGVLSDLDNYAPKVRKGGIVAGHDIGIYSVNMAVQAWVKRRLIDPKKMILVENQAWYWVVE
jgi:predicted O-methyltransferase YrrM